MPLGDAPIARVHERIARFFAVDEHPAAHPEVHAEHARPGSRGVEHDLLADPARGRERVADQRVAQRRRGGAPLEEPRVGRVHARDLAVERVRVEHRARRLDLQDLGHTWGSRSW